MYGIRRTGAYQANGTGRDMMVLLDPAYLAGRLGVGCLNQPDPYYGGPPGPKKHSTDGFNEFRTRDPLHTIEKVKNGHIERKRFQRSAAELKVVEVLNDSASKEKVLVKSFSTGNLTDATKAKWSRSMGTVADLKGPVRQPKPAPLIDPSSTKIKSPPSTPKKQRVFPFPEDADRHPYYGFSREPYGGYWRLRSFIGPG